MRTGRFLIKRLIYIIFVFFIISILMFAIYKSLPGDPVRMMMQGNIKPEVYQQQYEITRKQLGLDQPVPVQYVKWITNMLRGDFGYSTEYRRQVKEVIGVPMRNTVLLNLFSMIIVFLIAIPLGIATAVKKNSIFDKLVQVVTIIGYSVPSFVIALLAIYVFAIQLPIFPISGVKTAGFTGTGIAAVLDMAKHMALPVLVMSVGGIGSITRYVRASMIDALRMDYIKTARSKGLREKVVIYVHAFRNALIPIVTVTTWWLIGLFGGSIVIESIFLWDGLGKMMISGLNQRDFAVVLAMQMFYVILSLTGNVLMDIAYTLVDPRVKLEN
ncbi:MAG: ABC transporter permease [Lachnospiraceae bacterium]|nr:ABC transporter permease [Lachnospiraceae bacterium]MCI9400657.1 ABC transporter permease [Lachnospiraceae bacterium]MCX4377408.1 ABC transporter permease [Lachnospiraceae bacterium]